MTKNTVTLAFAVEETKGRTTFSKGGDYAIGIIAKDNNEDKSIETEGFIMGRLAKQDLLMAHIRITEILAEALGKELPGIPKEIIMMSLGETLTKHAKEELDTSHLKNNPHEVLKMIFSLLK